MLRFGYSKSRPPGGNQARRARFFMQVLGKKQLPPLRLVGAGWGWVVVVVVWLGSGWLGSG